MRISSAYLALACVISVSCSSTPERAPSNAASEADLWRAFPTDPPFETSAEELARFKALWKRALCLHETRIEGLHVARLNRTFHHKIHGCLRGKFKVAASRPADARVGIFSSDADLEAVARYSNINQFEDYHDDLRGLGVRLSRGALSQDFLVNDTRRHFASTPEEILEFNEYAARGDEGLREFALKDLESLKSVFGDADRGMKMMDEEPAKFIGLLALHPTRNFMHIHRLLDIRRNQADRPFSLLTKEFHSRAPFRLGAKTIKYAVVPCGRNGIHPRRRSASHLGEDLKANAQRGGLCLQLVARFFESEEKTPIHDYTKEWKSKPVVLGKFEFAPQDPTEDPAACEALVFSPWNTLPEHRPEGIVNKGRWYIYHASRTQSRPETRLNVSCSR
jgi:hypothetical protein